MENSVTVVVTILNEEKNLPDFLNSLVSQSLRPEKIIIVDGGSTDNSTQVVQKFIRKHKHLVLLQKKGNRSISRNFGVSQSKSRIIAFTDAGCIADKDWLKLLVEPFSKDKSLEVVSGYYRGQYNNIFEKSLIPYVLVMPDQIPDVFLPSTRSMAILRQSFLRLGGFDVLLDHNEDFAFANKIVQNNIQITFQRNAVVTWIPRKTLKESAWMFTRFALGDIQAGIIRPKVKKLIIRYIVAIYLFFICVQLPILWPIYILAGIIYLALSIFKNYKYVKSPLAIFWLPIIQIVSDMSVLFGSTLGLLYKISIK